MPAHPRRVLPASMATRLCGIAPEHAIQILLRRSYRFGLDHLPILVHDAVSGTAISQIESDRKLSAFLYLLQSCNAILFHGWSPLHRSTVPSTWKHIASRGDRPSHSI